MHECLYRQLKEAPTLSTAQTIFSGVSEVNFPVIGRAPMRITIGRLGGPIGVYVSSCIAHDLIIGNNFIKTYKVQYDQNKQRIFDESGVSVCAATGVNDLDEDVTVRLSEASVILPGTEVRLKCRLDRAVEGSQGFVEGRKSFTATRGLLTLSTYVPPSLQTHDLDVVMFNGSTETQRLERGTRIATMRRAENAVYLSSTKSLRYTSDKLTSPSPTLRQYTNEDVERVLKILEVDEIKLLDDEQRIFLKAMIRSWVMLGSVSVDEDDWGDCSRIPYRIETHENITPIRDHPRRYPAPYLAKAIEQLEKWQKAGIIKPSHSPWSFQPVLVLKKDGNVRVCIDYRRLNQVTIRDSFPLPRIDDTLAGLAGACIFSSFDLAWGFLQMQLDPQTAEKTAFSLAGHWQFTRLPFGVTNGPGAYQRLIALVLNGQIGKHCLCYIDDILVYSTTLEQHFAD